MPTDQQFVEKFFSLFRNLPPQREWVDYDEWEAEKEQMVERMRSIISDTDRNA